jgi:hypothetical protein
MQRGKMFTSVDIANSLKQRGDWIRNREVADYLRNNLVGISKQYWGAGYQKSTIDVSLPNGSYTEATLYHPAGTSASGYTKTAQKAMSPDEAKKDDPFSKVVIDSEGVSFDNDGATEDRTVGYSDLGMTAAELKSFTPQPTQTVNITIGSVETLIISPQVGMVVEEVLEDEED